MNTLQTVDVSKGFYKVWIGPFLPVDVDDVATAAKALGCTWPVDNANFSAPPETTCLYFENGSIAWGAENLADFLTGKQSVGFPSCEIAYFCYGTTTYGCGGNFYKEA